MVWPKLKSICIGFWVTTGPLTLSDRQILDSSKLNEFVDDIFQVDENAESFPIKYKTMGEKEKLLIYEQFLLFPQLFQKTFAVDTYKHKSVWERVKVCTFSWSDMYCEQILW